MYVAEVDTQFYVLEIRRLAASYQMGDSLSEVRVRVDDTIKSMQAMLGYDSDYQAEKWAELFNELGAFSTNNADPEWHSVIAYARRKVNCKKHSAIFRCKRSRK